MKLKIIHFRDDINIDTLTIFLAVPELEFRALNLLGR
jgi:hypothetical protein